MINLGLEGGWRALYFVDPALFVIVDATLAIMMLLQPASALVLGVPMSGMPTWNLPGHRQ